MADDFDDDSHVFAALDRLRRRADQDMARLTAHVTQPLRGSHGRLLGLVPEAGIRPSEIAADAWITKQAVGTRLREMEELGWIRREPDPEDGRALIVKRTAAGTRVRQGARQAIAALEDDWGETVGRERYATFRAVLDELGRPAIGAVSEY